MTEVSHQWRSRRGSMPTCSMVGRRPATGASFSAISDIYGIYGDDNDKYRQNIKALPIDVIDDKGRPRCTDVTRGRYVATTVLVCSTSGVPAKQWPTSARQAFQLSEPRKSTLWFSSVSHWIISR